MKYAIDFRGQLGHNSALYDRRKQTTETLEARNHSTPTTSRLSVRAGSTSPMTKVSPLATNYAAEPERDIPPADRTWFVSENLLVLARPKA
jgi:hypothetical protein